MSFPWGFDNPIDGNHKKVLLGFDEDARFFFRRCRFNKILTRRSSSGNTSGVPSPQVDDEKHEPNAVFEQGGDHEQQRTP